SGDGVWPLPLVEEYAGHLKHNLADLNNISSAFGKAGGIQAANFLKAFVPKDTRWVHFDVAGTAAGERKHRYFAPGGTGYGVRLIVEALRLLEEKGRPRERPSDSDNAE